MLTRIEIDGFKSFTNFSMEFSPLTIIAGLNASGKSNLFDALHLLSLLAEHDLNTAFSMVQRGSNLELFTQYADGRYAKEMRFAVEVEINPDILVKSGKKQRLPFLRLRYELQIKRSSRLRSFASPTIDYERFFPLGLDLKKLVAPYLPWVKESKYVFSANYSPAPFAIGNRKEVIMVEDDDLEVPAVVIKVPVEYNGVYSTVINWVGPFVNCYHLLGLKQEFQSWKLLQLDPKKLATASPRQHRSIPGPLNPAADNLAGVLWRLEKTDPYLVKRIAQRLASLVPGIKEIVVKHDDYYNQYRVFVLTANEQRFPLHLLSEGTLRMLALCTLAYDDQQHGVLGLEEPENGVHPGLLKRVAELLRDLSTNEPPEEGQEPWPLRQVIINTHSPGLIKACLEAAAGQGRDGGKSNLTVWFSQLVGRPVDEGGKRVMRRVTDMLPVVLPKIQPSEAVTAEMSESARRVSLAQLLRYLDTTAEDPLLQELGLPSEPSPPRD